MDAASESGKKTKARAVTIVTVSYLELLVDRWQYLRKSTLLLSRILSSAILVLASVLYMVIVSLRLASASSRLLR